MVGGSSPSAFILYSVSLHPGSDVARFNLQNSVLNECVQALISCDYVAAYVTARRRKKEI